jgi:tetratricopeptide (TPR) repeat protein
VGNLNGQISSLERLASQPNPDPQRLRQLIELLSLRGDMTGRIADIVRAAAMAENLPKDMGDKPDGYLTRASMRAALHRFDEAWSDLDEAERRGAAAAQTRGKRVSILAARGRVDEALTLALKARDERPTIDTIGIVAALLGEAGRKDEAIAAFREAFEATADTSPFPIAWLFFAQAQFWEREGNTELAMAYYKAVLERLPGHVHAAAHAARLATPWEAEKILKPMLESSDDPDVHTVLAVKLRARGDVVEAKTHVDAAAAMYEVLVTQHPAAFADHAAQFWLDAGDDPKKALELAKRNLLVRKTLKAYELAVVAALAAHDRKLACEIGTEGLEQARPTSMFREIVRGTCDAK